MVFPAFTAKSALGPRRSRGWQVLGLAAGLWGLWAGISTLPVATLVLRRTGLTALTAIAAAQSAPTSQEISQYARAVLAMDGPRTAALARVQELLQGANIDPASVGLNCADLSFPRMGRGLRRQVEDTVVGYCNQAREIVVQSGLTVQRFNEITALHRDNETIANQIRQELIRLQGE